MKNNKTVIIGIVLILCAVGIFILASRNIYGKTRQARNIPGNRLNMQDNSGPSQFQGGNQGNNKGAFDASNIDYAAAAQKLNINEDSLRTAMTVELGQRLNLESVATTLGVNIVDLRTALGMPEMGPPKVGSAMPVGAQN
jgi:hypothetical protein